MLLQRQEHGQNIQNWVIFSGWLCSFLGVVRGIGRACENHSNKPWDYQLGCTCGGAGLSCKCNTGEEPDISQVFEEKDSDAFTSQS
jgi:hypothetical protein